MTLSRLQRCRGCVTLLIGVLACRNGATGARDPVVRDSLGIRIVENFNDPVPLHQLTPRPIVQIGSATDTLTGLYHVEGAHRLADGRIVVANRGSDELRFFDADGAFIESVGRTGEGPGEFDYIAWMASCGADTMYVYDIGTRRLTVLDDQGNVVRLSQLMLPDNTLPYGASQCQLGGPFVSAGWGARRGQPGVHRDSMPVGLAGLDGDPVAMIGRFPGVDRWGIVRDGQYVGSSPLPLGRDLLQTIMNDRVMVGTGDAYEVKGFDRSGTLEFILRLDVPERPLTDADVDAYIEHELLGVEDPGRRAETRRYYLEMDLPRLLPPYASFIIDDEGMLWIQDYPGPRDTLVAWRRFATNGQYVGMAMFPAGLEVFEIGEGHVLGLQHDELDIEYVQLFGLGLTTDRRN